MREFIVACAICVAVGLTAPAGAQTADQAVQDGINLVDANPNSAEAWWMLGNAYWSKGLYDQASQAYNQSIEVDNTYGLAYLGRGNSYLKQGNYDRALEDYNLIIQNRPDFAGTYNNRAVAYREMGQHDQALQDLNHAIGLNPDFAEAFYNRALTYRSMGQQAMAQQDLKRAVELNPALGKALGDGKGGAKPALDVPSRADGKKLKRDKGGGKPGKAAGDAEQDPDLVLQAVELAVKSDPVLGRLDGRQLAMSRKSGDSDRLTFPPRAKPTQGSVSSSIKKLVLASLLPVGLAVVIVAAFLYYRLKH
ncbi:MAG: tetratricopeptide repeat protein [Verrucomicrobia bacterium]|nr:tetratricopeptide repeat protein [Verrucomicrobiota bacterium]